MWRLFADFRNRKKEKEEAVRSQPSTNIHLAHVSLMHPYERDRRGFGLQRDFEMHRRRVSAMGCSWAVPNVS